MVFCREMGACLASPPRQLQVSLCHAESFEQPAQPWAVAVGSGCVSWLAGTACHSTGQSLAARSLSWGSSLWVTVWGALKCSWSQQSLLPAR